MNKKKTDSIVLVGYGNVGKALHRLLLERKLDVDLIVRSSGIYSPDKRKIDEIHNYSKYLNQNTIAFIAVPSVENGELASFYYLNCFKKGSSIVTCEKAFLTYHWEDLKKYLDQIKYSATVGGDSGMLKAISEYQNDIFEVRAVVNGTLNYIGDRMAQGISKEEAYKEVINKGFAEPGSNIFDEVIQNELQDVLYKTVILANHSEIYKKIIRPTDIFIEKYKNGRRCFVLLTKTNIKAGFMATNDDSCFPGGANNVLYVNKQKILEGPGAGARITAERMFKDYEELIG